MLRDADSRVAGGHDRSTLTALAERGNARYVNPGSQIKGLIMQVLGTV